MNKYFNVLESKNLSNVDKKLLNKLFLLSQQRGYCYSSNEYLAMNLSIPCQEISKSIKKLKKLKMIKVANLDRDNIKGRKIFINL